MYNKIFKVVILVVLVAILGTQLTSVYLDITKQANENDKKAENSADLYELQVQLDTLTQLSEDMAITYQETAYSSAVDRISEQQLLATETQMGQLVLINQSLATLAAILAIR